MRKDQNILLGVVAAAVAGVVGYFVGRRNDAERTAKALLLQAHHERDIAESKRLAVESVKALAAARAVAAENDRKDAEKLAAMTPMQRQLFEEERAHDEKVARENRAAQYRLDLARQTAQCLVDAERRKVAAQEELLDEVQELRRCLGFY